MRPPQASWYIWTRNVAVLTGVVAYFLCRFVQTRYIVKRYEDETTLRKTRFFSHPVFSAFSPPLWRHLVGGVYTIHLFGVWLLSEGMVKHLASLADLESRDQVLRHFSRKELALSVAIGAAVMLSVFAAVVLLVLRPFV